MKYTLNLDEKNYILSIANTADDNVELDLKSMELEYLQAYKYENDTLTLDENKKAEIIAQDQEEAKQTEIQELRKKLQDTDYIWNVIQEGDRTKEYYADVIEQRHQWRKRIRELEN